MSEKIIIRTKAHNAEDTIERTIESILNQTYTNFEYYICDNGSTDNTTKIIQKYAQKDSRIHAFYNKENNVYNQQTYAFRDMMYHILDENFYATLDADDQYMPTFLEETLAMVQKYQVDIVIAGFKNLDYSTHKTIGQPVVSDKLIIINDSNFENHIDDWYNKYRCVWGNLYSGKIINKFTMPKKEMSNGLDTYFLRQMIGYSQKTAILPKTLTNHYINNKNSASNKFSPSRLNMSSIFYKQSSKLFKEKCGKISLKHRKTIFLEYIWLYYFNLKGLYESN